MSEIIQSLKTKFELVAVSAALLGMMCTGVYVYSSQTSQLNLHEAKILAIESKGERRDTKAQAMADVIAATVIPAINSQAKELVTHGSRLDAMERNARADREILLEIRNDLKWLRMRVGPAEE